VREKLDCRRAYYNSLRRAPTEIVKEMHVYRFYSFAALAVVSAAAASATVSAQAPQPAANAQKSMSKADFTKNIDNRFQALDANHDGFLSKSELAAAQAKALQEARAIEEQRLEAEFKKLDTNKDNQLSLAEFKAAAPGVKTSATPDQMLAELDSNKDGKVSEQEYRARPLANFDKLDLNKDGIVTAEEMKAARKR
jgi:Ca2+-binding EF-hand superfamily protein